MCDGAAGDLDAKLDEAFRVEASGWKGEQGTAITSTPAMRAFYTSMAHWAASEGMLHLVLLWLDDRMIACMLFLRDNDVLRYLKGGYDEAFSKYGPGIWLMHDVLQQAFADGTRRIEWLGADDRYKLEWSDGTDHHVTSTWFAPSLRNRVEYHARDVWRTSRARGKDLLRERLSDTVIERLKAAKTTLTHTGPRR